MTAPFPPPSAAPPPERHRNPALLSLIVSIGAVIFAVGVLAWNVTSNSTRGNDGPTGVTTIATETVTAAVAITEPSTRPETATETVTQTAQATVPAACLRVIDLAEQIMNNNADAMGVANDMLSAAGAHDTAAMQVGIDKLAGLDERLKPLGAQYRSARDACQAGG